MSETIITGLRQARDAEMGEPVTLRDRAASVPDDVQASGRVPDALGHEGPALDERHARQHRRVIVARNERRRCRLRERRKGEPMPSRDLAERLRCEEGEDIRDQRLVLDVIRRVSRALRLLQTKRALTRHKDRLERWM